MIKNITSFIIFFALILISSTVYSQSTGSINGDVTDMKDKAPLIGATVKIVGSNMGAITDDNGAFTILNVDVGTYTIEASYMGYETKRVSGVKVSVDQRAKVNFELGVTTELKTDVIVIEAERKGIDVDQSGRLVTQESIDNAGLRGINNIVSKTAGVVSDDRGSSINIRGGRSSENLVIVDGVSTTNPLDGSSSAFVPNSLMQEVSVLTGGFGAEYGNALSGVINVSTKRGTDRYSGSAEVISDIVAGDWMKTVSQGYNLYNITFGGPLIPTKGMANVINFFGAVERTFSKSYQTSWIADKTYTISSTTPGSFLPKTTKITPNNGQSIWSFNGRLNINLIETKAKIPVNFRFGYSNTENDRRFLSSSFWLQNSFRMPRAEQNDQTLYGRIIHNVSSKFFYELQANYYKTTSEQGDNIFWNNLYQYGDSTFNPGIQWGRILTIDPATGNLFAKPNTVYNFYQKTDVSYYGGKLDATWALNTKNSGDHEFKFGGEYKYHTLRKISAGQPSFLTQPGSGLTPMNIWYGRDVSGRFYGYDVLDQNGNLVDPATTSPMHPIVGAFYLRDKIDFGDFTINAGLRLDYLDVNTKVLKNISQIYTPDGVLLDPSLYTDNEKPLLFSPRLGFSFPVTDKVVFIAQFGKFVQMPPLDYLYISKNALYAALNNSVQDVYENATLKPERLTSYEFGFKQTVGDYVDLGVTAYYRETADQIGITRLAGQIVNGNPTSGYGTYFNSDFSISRGMDFYLSLRRVNRLAVDLAYTLLYATGIGSNPDTKSYLGSNGGNDPNDPTSGFPKYVFPLDYDQRHTGSINLDYRFGSTDVPKGFLGDVMKNLGVNLLFTFNSGRPYTSRELPTTWSADDGRVLSTKNSLYTDWSLRFDLKVDKAVNVFKTNWLLYVYVQNLFNTETVNAVFGSTGLPGTNGFLSTPTGQSSTPEFQANYPLRFNAAYNRNWGVPRQVRFGVRVSL